MFNTDDNSANIKKSPKTGKHENPITESKIKEKMDVKSSEEKIQNLIILNAWRRQREKNKQLEVDVKSLTNQVESLQLQIYALKHLLDGEKSRVVHFNSDLRKILTSLEECKHEKHSIEKEKEQLEVRLHVMEDKLARVEMECKNQKNELVTAKSEAQNWEKQLEKEREKLTKMKDERKFFLEEVRFKGNLLMWQIRSFEQFSRFFNSLQSKPNNPALPWDKLIERNEPEPENQKRPKKQQTVVTLGKHQENRGLKSVRPKLGRKIQEEDVKIEELEKSNLGKTEENSLVPYYPSVSKKF